MELALDTVRTVLADRVAVLRDGRLLQWGTFRQLASQAADPYVQELISAPQRQARLLQSRLGDLSA